jgi:hypothetical protein
VLLHGQPDADAWGSGWADDLGVEGLAEDLTAVLPAIAFGLGLLFGLTFDTTGPGVREVSPEEYEARRRRGYVGPVPVDARAEDEPFTSDREVADRRTNVPTDRDADGVPDQDETYAGAPRTRDDGDRYYEQVPERGTPVAPQPDLEATRAPGEPSRRDVP